MGFGGWTMQEVRFSLAEIDWLYQEADKERCSLETLIRNRVLNLDGEIPGKETFVRFPDTGRVRVSEAACAEGGGA
jgi:hypothetical protein